MTRSFYSQGQISVEFSFINMFKFGQNILNARTLHYAFPSSSPWSIHRLLLIYPWPSNLARRGYNLIWSRGWLNVGNAGHAVI